MIIGPFDSSNVLLRFRIFILPAFRSLPLTKTKYIKFSPLIICSTVKTIAQGSFRKKRFCCLVFKNDLGKVMMEAAGVPPMSSLIQEIKPWTWHRSSFCRRGRERSCSSLFWRSTHLFISVWTDRSVCETLFDCFQTCYNCVSLWFPVTIATDTITESMTVIIPISELHHMSWLDSID